MANRNRVSKRSRRGVLLLVVLSLLVMFLLAGMTFIVVASSFKKSTTILSRHQQTGDAPENIFDVALNDFLRGPSPQNTQSVLSGSHSLLEDAYGRDGFIGEIVGFEPTYAVEKGTVGQFIEFRFRLVRYLDAVQLTSGEYQPGPNGELLRSPAAGATDPQRLINVTASADPDPRYVMSMAHPTGVVPVLGSDDTLYNGCAVTFLNGSSSSITTRVMALTKLSTILAADNSPITLSPQHLGTNAGSMLVLQTSEGVQLNIGDRFLVNGRPYNGTGSGFASATQNVDRQLGIQFDAGGTTYALPIPTALAPNEVALRQTVKDLRRAALDGDIAAVDDLDGDTDTDLRDVVGYLASANVDVEANVFTLNDAPVSSHMQADESWDAPDFQNMHLASIPWIENGIPFADQPIIASFHRPDLANYWFNQLIQPGQLLSSLADKKTAIHAFEYPYGKDRLLGTSDDTAFGNTLTVVERELLLAVRRMTSMRPLPEDNPEFDGSNVSAISGEPAFHSILSGLTAIGSEPLLNDWTTYTLPDRQDYVNPGYDPTVPFSLPLDVDNDGDGVADSIWMDLGFPTMRTADGRVYKPLIAPLCIDLDSRVNVNSADRQRNSSLVAAPWQLENPWTPGLESSVTTTFAQLNADLGFAIPGGGLVGAPVVGSGVGPAEISLFTNNSAPAFTGLADVVNALGTGFSTYGDVAFNYDTGLVARTWMAERYRSEHSSGGSMVYEQGINAVPSIDSSTAMSDFAHKNWEARYKLQKLQRAAHWPVDNPNLMRPADNHGHSTVVVNHNGQPIYANSSQVDEFANLPYESNLVRESRFDSRFDEEDLEGILRAWDPSRPESRLLTSLANPAAVLTPEVRQNQVDLLARRLRSMVTTRSFEVPSLPRLLPADYGFEVRFENTVATDNDFLFHQRRVLIDKALAPIRNIHPATDLKDGSEMRGLTTIADLFRARLLSEHATHGGLPWTPTTNVMSTNFEEFAYDMAMMLPYEIARGQRFDINRPFGDGLDNDGGGFIDETDFVPLTMSWGPVEVLGETGDLSFTPINMVNGNPLLLNLANTSLDGFQRTIPTVNPLRQTFARHLYCLMMFMMPADYQPDMDGDGGPFDLDDRKLLARSIAQYAINVVDARDSDSKMTPFEFDVNPYNGWDVVYDMQDVAGDEEETVWGMEKPEVLITETLAHHDIRSEDLPAHGETTDADPATKDEDFDQRLMPQSSFFAEMYNCGDQPVALGLLGPDGAPVYRMMVALTPPAGTPDPDPDDPDKTDAMKHQYVDRFIYFSEPTLTDNDLHKVRPSDPTELTPKPYFYRRNDVALASLLPGRYAVLGSGREEATDEYETYFGRTTTALEASDITTFYDDTRQIVLKPLSDANTNQVWSDNNVNAYDIPLVDRQPAIAVMVDEWRDPVTNTTDQRPLSISDPPMGYTKAGFVQSAVNGEGAYSMPIDVPSDLRRSVNEPTVTIGTDVVPKWQALGDIGTTNGFRTIYLQRLADPQRPWDPLINPYRTVDRATTDLTVMNGLMSQSAYVAATTSDELNVDFSTVQRGQHDFKTAGLVRALWRAEPRRQPLAAAPPQDDVTHHFAYSLKHTLGYVNNGYGNLVSNSIVQSTNTTVDTANYRGSPLAVGTVGTFPWLTWNNRPYTSAAELMLVPYSRSSTLGNDYAHRTMLFATPAGGQATDDEYGTVVNPTTTQKVPLRSAAFGHLLDFFGTETTSMSTGYQKEDSPHLYRLLDYVEVRSPFAGTDQSLGVDGFGSIASAGTTGYRVPMNYVSRFRNPGKVNANTVRDPRVWSSVNASYPGGKNFEQLRASRRGAPNVGTVEHFPNEYPTMFANPFRAASNATLMPNSASTVPAQRNLSKDERPVDATLLRASTSPTTAMPTNTPFHMYASNLPYNNTARNPAFRYQGYQRMQNLTTTQSNVYAMWMTVGYFEVNPETGQLGQELGMDSGDMKRHRAFYVIDRSIPVAFEPGKNHNVDKAVVLRRMIE